MGAFRPLMRRLRAAISPRRALLALLLTVPAVPALAGACPSLPHPAIASARFAEARGRVDGVRIVAFGSSSTAGAGASEPGHTYPALLEARLRAALDVPVTVLNRGRGGEDADNMLVRLDRDVIAERPDLVIWQLGANAAMRRMDPAAFAGSVREGVHRLREAGIDVVLMDNQRAPRIAANPDHDRFDAALAEIAATTPGVALFSRGTLMDRWTVAGVPPAALLVPDELHHNDRGYACVAEAMAEALLASPPPILARRAR
ncbi:SGNH/GDSL hydrolase family protein [Roseomonas terrae]|jgi:acyl-CoA thioesterase-1|uniref:SGNH/GDSL hydrolase family protein n=2 Tax=Neoroseomonas terrae TaxID=424799 RepID=A0ABS5EQT2_9PROT|nr:SGNH/GDSL hydrolase family protein [Neoroseomonas terrae]